MTRQFVVVICALALVACATPSGAFGGLYTISTCPDASNYENRWVSDEFGSIIGPRRAFENCAGGEFGLDLGGEAVADGATVGWTFYAPVSSFIQSFRWQRRVNATAPYVYELSGGSGQRMIESSNPSRAPEFAASNDLWESRHGSVQGPSLNLRLRCEAAPGTLCDDKPATVTFRAAEIDLVDLSLPVLLTQLVSDAPPGNRPDSFTLYTGAYDDNSGIKSLEILQDGRPIAAVRNDLTGACMFYARALRPCPMNATVSAVIPRSAVVDGPVELEVYAEDGSGNRMPGLPVTVRSSYVEPPTSNVVVPTTPTQRPRGVLSASFAGGGPAGPSAYSKPPTVRGTFRDEGGTPIAGAKLDVETRALFEGADSVRAGAITTDSKGAFAWKVPRGSSREIRLIAATPGGTSVAGLVHYVRAPISLKTSRQRTRNGRTVRFTGAIADVPAGARTRVELQAWAGRWVPFANATVSRGRFSARYTFKRTLAATTYRFRAVLPSDPNFPYAPATSKQVRVRVVP